MCNVTVVEAHIVCSGDWLWKPAKSLRSPRVKKMESCRRSVFTIDKINSF